MPATKRNAPQSDGSSILSSDVVECILVRLPVKSLLRFKSVCNLWKAIISNPHFTKIQSQASSAYPCLFLVRQRPEHHETKDPERFCLLKFEQQRFRLEAALEIPFKSNVMLCSCNGIILLQEYPGCSVRYTLWNPCSRMRTTIWLPFDWPVQAYGLCYDPTTNDYKVVIITTYSGKYSVFSCKKKAWTKRNEQLPHETCYLNQSGVYVNGVVYWLCDSSKLSREAMFFDGIHDKCGKLQLPCSPYPPVTENYPISCTMFLVNVRGCLGTCAYFVNNNAQDHMVIRFCIIEKNGDISSCKWMTVLEEHLTKRKWCENHKWVPCVEKPPCAINDGTIVVFVDCSRYVVYDICNEMVIGKPQGFQRRWSSKLFKCQDHLVFPIQNVLPWRKCRRISIFHNPIP